MHHQKKRSVSSLLQRKPSHYKSRFNFDKASSFLFPSGPAQSDAKGSATVNKNLATFFVNVPKQNDSPNSKPFHTINIKKKPLDSIRESDNQKSEIISSQCFQKVNDSESSNTQGFFDRTHHFRLSSIEHVDDISDHHDIIKYSRPQLIKNKDSYRTSHAYMTTLNEHTKATPNTTLTEFPHFIKNDFTTIDKKKLPSPAINTLSSLVFSEKSNSSEMESKHVVTPTRYNESNSFQINDIAAYSTQVMSPRTHFVNALSSPGSTSPNERPTNNEKKCSLERKPQQLPSVKKFSRQTTLSINQCQKICPSKVQPFYSYALDESSFSSIDQFRIQHEKLNTSLTSQSSESSSCSPIGNYPSTKFLLNDLHEYTATVEWHHVYVHLSSKH